MSFFVIRVTVTNSRQEPVVVDLRPNSMLTFWYELTRPDGSGFQDDIRLADLATVRLGPRESKEQLFDARVTTGTNSRDFGPGDITVLGAYGDIAL